MELQPPIGQRPSIDSAGATSPSSCCGAPCGAKCSALEAGAPLKDWRWPADLAAQLNVPQEECEAVPLKR